MTAGDLDRRVTISTPSLTADAIGGQVVSWSTLVADLPANIRYLTGREALEAQTITGTASVWITIRYRADITPKMRVSYRSNTFEIQTVQPSEGRDQFLALWCSVVQGATGATV